MAQILFIFLQNVFVIDGNVRFVGPCITIVKLIYKDFICSCLLKIILVLLFLKINIKCRLIVNYLIYNCRFLFTFALE